MMSYHPIQSILKRIALVATKNKFIRSIIEKRRISLKFPSSLFIEPTNSCNLKCNMCPQSEEQNQESSIKRGFMDFDLYKRVIEESVRFGRRTTIFFHKDGEPLLHPMIGEMIRYAVNRKAAFQTHMSTNAHMLKGELMEKILKSGLDSMVINIDAATSETYMRIKGCGGFEDVERNIEDFIILRNKLGLVKPLIRVKFIPVEENMGEIELFRKRWSKLADDVVISNEFSWPGFSKDGEGQKEAEERYPCITLWLALTINWDGTVSVCCIDFYHRGTLGNITYTTIQELWTGKKLHDIRIAHLEGNFASIPVCSDCKGLWIRDNLGLNSERYLRKKMKIANL